MENKKLILTYFLIICILFSITSCAQSQKKPNPKPEDEPKPVPPVVEKIEEEIIGIMQKADLIPYYEKQISEKKKKEQEKKQMLIQMGQKSDQGGNQEGNQQSQQGGKNEQAQGKKEGIDELTEFKPAPITINDILLSEILKQEMTDKKGGGEQDIPDDILSVWHEINSKIMNLHEMWNSLEPDIIKSGISQEPIKGFDNTLNSLTVLATQQKYMDTLLYSNKLTYYIPELINNFKKKEPNSIYYLKYYVRQIVLDANNNDYVSADKNMKQVKIYKDNLISVLVEKKLADLANKLNISISDLENAIKVKNLSIIKIKSQIVMKNLTAVKEEISK